jgi:hypothetical protein
MSGINLLRRLLMKQAMKKSAPFQHEGIMSINKNLVNDVDNTVKKWVDSAKSQGQDIDKMGEQELKYLIELNKPKVHQGTTNERFDALAKHLEKRDTLFGPENADVFDLTGKKIPPGSQIMGGEEVIVDVVTETVTNMKKMTPMDAMKEANSVIARKGKYKNLTKEQSKKILKDTNDHIFERDIKYDEFGEIIKPDPEDLAEGGRTGFFTGALADTKQGKAMSPGTSADYSPGQGHRQNVGAPPGITTAPTHVPKPPEPPKRTIRDKIGGGINKFFNNPLVRGYAAWGSGGLSEKLRASMMAKQLYDNRHFLGDEAIEEEVQNIPTMGGIVPAYAHGGRTSTGLNYLLGEDDQNSRVPYAGGGMGRRLFLKLMGGAAAGTVAAKSGVLCLLKAGKPAIVKDLTSVPIGNASGMPAWFKPLVNKVIKEGREVSGEADRIIVHHAKLPESKTLVYVSQDLNTGNVAVDIGIGKHSFSAGHHGQPVRLEYRASEVIESTINKQGKVTSKGTKTKPEFNVEEAEFTGGHPENIKFEETSIEKFGEHGSDFSEVEKFATGKTTKASKKGSKQVWEADWDDSLPDYEDFASGGRVPLAGGGVLKGILALGKGAAKGEGKFTKSEVLIKMLEKTLKGSKDPWSKTNLPNFIKELKAKPELANDPQVWNYFTGKLPKNQRLVVHSDDTVDFWTQSEFGPHNIKTTDKFMQKHPNLSRDEAVKIQNMEPEDQILEMKRLETIADRSRTKNASGGRVSLSAGGLAGMLGE